MNEYLKIKVTLFNYENFIKYCYDNTIELYNIKRNGKEVICTINNNNLNKISKFYDVTIIKFYTKKYYYIKLRKNLINIFNIIYAIILFLFLSNIIVKVDINLENKELLNTLTKELDSFNIKRLSMKKDFKEISDIKNKVMDKLNNDIEWLEIENIGMTYNIKLELRKKNLEIIKNDRCHIIANKNGVVSKIVAESGDVITEKNSYVKTGDILISGNIMLNEENKNDICAKGKIYAERWYSVKLDIPTTIDNKIYTNKKRYNLLFEYDNRDYKIFKDRLNSYDENKYLIISLLGKKLYLLKDYEYILESKELDEEALNKRIDELVISKLDLSLADDEKILYKNVLKKEVINSRIIIEMFVTVEELISESITY